MIESYEQKMKQAKHSPLKRYAKVRQRPTLCLTLPQIHNLCRNRPLVFHFACAWHNASLTENRFNRCVSNIAEASMNSVFTHFYRPLPFRSLLWSFLSVGISLDSISEACLRREWIAKIAPVWS